MLVWPIVWVWSQAGQPRFNIGRLAACRDDHGIGCAGRLVFAGLRIIDFSNPMRPRQTACYLPEAAEPPKRVSSNDVFVDSRGLIFLIDRVSGLTILERT
jgi:hypothetical protein